jgi:type II secretory pathway component GspD/PulD (secretin)
VLFVRLAQKTGLRLIVDDTVKRTVTVNLVDKKVTEIISSIVATYGLSCREVNGITMISEGIPKSPSSYLLSDIDAISTKYVLAPTAKSLLPIFLQDHVKTNQGQNSVILSAPADVLRKFREDIAQFDIPASQIMIDVLMVELSDSGSKEFGLKWSWSNGKHGVSVDAPFGQIIYQTITDLPTQFSAQLKALVTQGKARVRANPRIATVSGQLASIFIGKQRYISTPVDMSGSEGSLYGYNQTNSIDAGVKLEMTPWTGGEGEIIVDIHPEISVLSAPDAVTGLPERSTRRANTTVHVRDGETIIIGGLLQQEQAKTHTKVPILGDIPLIGQLFRTKDETFTATDMVIFVTPRILSQTGHLPADQEKPLLDRLHEDGPSKKPTK